jgi:transcriptional regulator with XRE-family HTH domain
MTSDATRFGELLQQYRRRARLTQTELSGFSTVSVRAIRNLELGQAKNPRRETVRLLVDALRLGGAQRAALQLAAGLEADDVAFLDLSALPAVAARTPHGRDAEREMLLQRLCDGRRFVTVSGLGGVGKTRLALTVAHALRATEGIPTLWLSVQRLADGARRPRTDDLQLPSAVWTEGLLTRNGGVTGEAARLIGDRSVLLVVDGNDRGEVARETVETLLASCPGLRVLETSRTPRGRHADFRLALGPLPAPALTAVDDLRGAAVDPALAVLLDRLTELQPDVRLDAGNVAALLEICSRLDELPRALESAAAWFPLCSLDEIVRLARTEPDLLAAPPGDGPAADWVHEALDDALADLTPDHHALLRRLAGWDTPWTVEQVVTRLGIGRVEVAGAVDAFLRRGLIRRLPSASLVVFGVLHVVRASLRARQPARLAAPLSSPLSSPLTSPLTSQGIEEQNCDGSGSGWTARGRGAPAGVLGGRARREDAA